MNKPRKGIRNTVSEREENIPRSLFRNPRKSGVGVDYRLHSMLSTGRSISLFARAWHFISVDGFIVCGVYFAPYSSGACAIGIQLCELAENSGDDSIATNAHEWKCALCICPDTSKKPTTCHCAATM